jgi:hypothetical protein
VTHLVKPFSRPIVLFLALAAVLAGGALQVATAAAAGEEHRYLPELSRSYSVAEAEEEPCGVAIDSAGNRYVSAPEIFMVQVYDPAGEPITEFEPEGNFGLPCDLAVDASGAVYVDDFEGMVVKYVPAEPLDSGSAFELDDDAGDGGVIVEEGAFAVAVNPADQHLFAGEGDRISEYDSDGVFVAEVGDAVPTASWRGLDVHGTTGDVYAIDAQANRVHVLDSPVPLTEESWTDADNPKLTPYTRSKTIAERAAWDLVRERGEPERLAVVNPGAILGPLLSDDRSFSLELIERLLKGMPGTPRLGYSIVDVRDVADLQLKAMTAAGAGGERFIAVNEFRWMSEVAAMLRDRLGPDAAKVPRRSVPDLLVRGMAVFDPSIRSIVGQLGRRVEMSSEKARTRLGWSPRPVEETVVECARSLVDEGLA